MSIVKATSRERERDAAKEEREREREKVTTLGNCTSPCYFHNRLLASIIVAWRERDKIEQSKRKNDRKTKTKTNRSHGARQMDGKGEETDMRSP